MSDTPPDNSNDANSPQASGGNEIDALLAFLKSKIADADLATQASSAAVAKAVALREEVERAKAAFDSEVQSSTTEIQNELNRVKTAAADVDSLKTSIANARGSAESDVGAAEQAVAKIKTALSDAENIKTEVATIRGAVEATRQAATSDAANVAQAKNDAEALKAAAATLSEKLNQEHNDIASRITALQEQQAALQSILADLASAKATAEADSNAAKNYLTEIEAAKIAFVNLGTDTQAQYDALVQRQTALQGKIVEIEDSNNKIGNLRRALLESSADTKSVQDEISDLRAQIAAVLSTVSEDRAAAVAALNELTLKAQNDGSSLHASLTEKFEKLHESLRTTILGLLPSAGAAGLSSTYFDAKSRYSPTSYSKKPGAQQLTGWRLLFRTAVGYNPASLIATIVFYAMFVAPIAIIAYGSLTLLFRMENDPHFVVDYKMLIVRALIAVPLATLSGFGLLSLQRYRKLYEQYDHKQRVMELYQSFGNEIAKNGDESHKKELLSIMLASVASKTWESAAEKSDGASMVGASDALSTLERFADDIGKVKSALAG